MSESQILLLKIVGAAIIIFFNLGLLVIMLGVAQRYFGEAISFGRNNPLFAATLAAMIALPAAVLFIVAIGGAK